MRGLVIQTSPIFQPLMESNLTYQGAKGGRGSGKSYLFADKLIKKMIENPNLDIVCIREVQKSIDKSSKKLIEDRIKFYQVGDYFDIQKTEIRSTKGDGVIIFQGLQDHTADTIKSLEGFDICWVEEAQSISEYSLDILTPTFRKDNVEMWFSWNPRFSSDPVMKLFKNNTNSILVHANYLDNKFCTTKTKREAEDLKIKDEDKYKHIYLGGIQDNLDALFNFRFLNDARNRVVSNMGIHTWSLDVARYGSDTSVLSKRKGQELFVKSKYEFMDTMELASKVAYLYNQETVKPLAIFVDVIGVGAGVADRLRQLGLPVIDVNGAMTSDSDVYANKRAEMYFNFFEFLKQGRIELSDNCEQELMSIEYFDNNRGKTQLIKKDDIKKALGRSPDESDSYAMHFAYKIQPKVNNDTHQYQQHEGSQW